MKQLGAACLADIQQVDQTAQAIIHQIRAQYPGGRLPSKSALPAVPPILKQLTQQRDDVTNASVEKLQAALGPAAFQRVDTYIKTQLAKNVTTIPIVIHPVGGAPLSAGSANPAGGTK